MRGPLSGGGSSFPSFVDLSDVQFPVLPHGIYEGTIDDVLAMFVSSFSPNDQRQKVFDGWSTFRTLIRSLVQVDEEYIDGSFVTKKPSPKDLDVSFWISADNLNSMDPIYQRFLENLMQSSKSYNVDAYIVPHCPPGHPQEAIFQYMLWTKDNWTRCRDKKGNLHPQSGPKKGYVRVVP